MNTYHFPYCYANHASIHHALKFKLCTESLLSMPKSAVIDGIISYGGSTGIGLQLPAKAYSEFFERNHLFTTVPIHKRQPLAAIKPAAFRDKLVTLCQFSENQAPQCLNHAFAFTTVYHLFDQTPQDYFFNTISLKGLESDAAYLNFSDSCACAAHVTKEDALYNSLMEFLERQALLGSWLAKTYRYAINPEVLKYVTPYSTLTEKLLENGELYIFENGNHLPGYTVIMFYFSHSEQDIVQYSIGASSGLSLSEALTSSLEELYQCYTFLYNTENSSGLKDKAGSGYHLNFQQCNHQGNKAIIPFLHQKISYAIHSIEDIKLLKTFTYSEILSALSAISTDIYYYHHYEKTLNLHFTKIVSPDFFAHMSLNKPLNFSNNYAKMLGITQENAYLHKIPFP